tara:strand:+ start:634 stop:1059 length:426 start_codon:yes stop_codon:yes gene_type:complete
MTVAAAAPCDPGHDLVHIAIPCRDLDETVDFYGGQLGCPLYRRYDDRVTFDFFGAQLVCHLSPQQIDPAPRMYPRHFGMTFRDREVFDRVHGRAQAAEAAFFKALFPRFKGKREEHLTFFLRDPANNLLEFKYYHDPEMMF